MELPVVLVPQAICVLEKREEDNEKEKKESDAIVSYS